MTARRKLAQDRRRHRRRTSKTPRRRCATAQARLNSSQTRLTRRKVFEPGRPAPCKQVYYRPGEMVPAGRPVVALLPPGNLKVRFYVPEAVLPQLAYGDVIKVNCDGCAGDHHRARQLHRQRSPSSRRR